MGFSKEKIKQICLLMVFAAVLVLAVMYSSAIFKGIGLAVSIASPFIIGGAIAFVLNIPMKSIEEKLLKKWNGKIAKKVKRPVSMLLAIIILLLIVTFVILTVVPQLTTAASVLGQKVPTFIDKVMVELQQLSVDMDRQQITAMEMLESLQALQTQLEIVALRLRQRFAAPVPETVKTLLDCFDGYSAFVKTLSSEESGASLGMKLKYHTFETLWNIQSVYQTLSHT